MTNKYLKGTLLSIVLTFIASFTNAQHLTDQNATKETRALYKNLHRISQSFTLFGHQDDLAYGVNWKYVPGKSDIKAVVNDYPAVYGWDLGYIEKGSPTNIDGVPFDKMREYIKTGYRRGAVITLSWHFGNPLTGGTTWDTTQRAVASILPGGIKHELFKTWLNRAANFIASLKGPRNEPIPVLFRPFHELNGDWFWWGKNKCTAEEFKQLWRFTINYLRDEKKLHNLIIVYNTNSFSNEAEFLEKYPGNDMADVLSFDKYQFNEGSKAFISSTRKELTMLVKMAKERDKLAAFAETGYEAVPDALWWTKTLLPTIKDIPIAYVLVWRNAGYMPSMQKFHFYAPYDGHKSAPDFRRFYQNPSVIFEKTTRKKNLYQN